jgi:hypothetical protein
VVGRLEGKISELKQLKAQQPDHVKLHDACKLEREIEVLLEELQEWKKAQVQPKRHRERDRTRRPSAHLVLKKVMTSRLKVARRL